MKLTLGGSEKAGELGGDLVRDKGRFQGILRRSSAGAGPLGKRLANELTESGKGTYEYKQLDRNYLADGRPRTPATLGGAAQPAAEGRGSARGSG
jgi:hypothetical protein